MADNKALLESRNIGETFSILFDDIEHLIKNMKLNSSEEILNGSINEAQKLLSKIIPYQTFYEKLKVAKTAFDSIEQEEAPADDPEVVILEVEENTEVEFVAQEPLETKNGITAQEKFRIPILKSLIFLGGVSEEEEVVEFVKKDMKNKLTKEDYEIPVGEDNERWLSNIYFETATMIDEGLLSKDAPNKKWEIAQKGIDHLSKHAK